MVRASLPNQGRKPLRVGGGSEELAREVTQLLALDAAALQQRWVAIFGANSSPCLGRRLMIRALAYRLQEGALGGLKPGTQRLLDRIAEGRSEVALERISETACQCGDRTNPAVERRWSPRHRARQRRRLPRSVLQVAL